MSLFFMNCERTVLFSVKHDLDVTKTELLENTFRFHVDGLPHVENEASCLLSTILLKYSKETPIKFLTTIFLCGLLIDYESRIVARIGRNSLMLYLIFINYFLQHKVLAVYGKISSVNHLPTVTSLQFINNIAI